MFKLFLAFQEALTYMEPDPTALMELAVDRDRCVLWHHRFVTLARFFGLLAGIAVLAALIAGLFIGDGERPNPRPNAVQMVAIFVLGPPTAFLMGCVFGATFACLIAPRDFLLGPLGRKWMGFVGTANIYVAKIVCIIILAGMTVGAVGMTLGVIRGMHAELPTKEKAKGPS